MSNDVGRTKLDIDALRRQLGIPAAASSFDVHETITPRSLSFQDTPTAATPETTASAPSLPHISVAMPGAESTDPSQVRTRDPSTVDLQVTGILGEGGMGRVLL